MKNVEFEKRNKKFTKIMAEDNYLKTLSRKWLDNAFKYEYSYHFTWLGRPIIQFPQDIIAMQELIWKTKPDYVVIIPWNLKDEIIRQIHYIREWGGKFVIPIPQVKIL